MTFIEDNDREPELNEELKILLDLNALNWLKEDFPALYTLVKNEVEAGKSRELILTFCARLDGMNDDLMHSIEGTIEHLERAKEHGE